MLISKELSSTFADYHVSSFVLVSCEYWGCCIVFLMKEINNFERLC